MITELLRHDYVLSQVRAQRDWLTDLKKKAAKKDAKALAAMKKYKVTAAKLDKAIELLQLNEAYYPDSFVTFNSLGEAYRVAGNPEAARRACRKALALRADNPIAQRALAELTQPKP